jgi:ribose transport system ATP-binding protein
LTTVDAAQPVLELEGISKHYPGVKALDDVSLAVRPGEVHTLVGGNGAGKSTLINVAAGAVIPDAGTVRIAGRRFEHPSPVHAVRLGMRVIHQERQIAGDLTVGENVLLGQLPARLGRVDWRGARRRARQALERVGLDLDPQQPVRGLAVQQLQQIEIARALSANARVVIMDEPTAALAPEDIGILFDNVRRLREVGVGVVYISHHLDEVFGLADRITVLRDGRRVTTLPAGKPNRDQLVELMFGRGVKERREVLDRVVDTAPEVALEVRRLELPPGLRGVDLDVRRGEVLCVTGAVGSGRRELAHGLIGRERPARGTIRVNGHRDGLRSPRHAARHGIAFVPQDRKAEGLLIELDVTDNIAVARDAQYGRGVVRPARRRRRASDACRRLQIKTPDVGTAVRTLSGGNQQKVLLARCLEAGARVLVLDEPTAGIDVHAKFEIFELLRGLAQGGAAVVVFSSDYEEIKVLADRCLVLRAGRVVGELAREDISEERLLATEHQV